MVYVEKSQPAPPPEKVFDRLIEDFRNKCYICEQKEPTGIDIEHFIPHSGNETLKSDWNNLFYSCVHCNGRTKGDTYNNVKKGNREILNCTKKEDDVENKLRYILQMQGLQTEVQIEALDSSEKTKNTKGLLLDVYNGKNKSGNENQKREAGNLRKLLCHEIRYFQGLLSKYEKKADKEDLLDLIKAELNRASAFTAFKRWIIKENARLAEEFGKYID